MALLEAAVQGIELEAFNKSIPDLVYSGKTLYNRIKKATKTYPTANITAAPNTAGVNSQRPAFRVPMYIQSGGALAQGTGNGDSMGRGTGSQWVSGDLAPVFLYQGCEITYLSQIATAGPKRALVSVRAQELKNTLDTFLRGLESLANGDGSGALDQIPVGAVVNSATGGGSIGTATYSSIQVQNANQFQDQQVIQIFPSEGGSTRGSVTITYADGVTNTLYFATALPAGTAAGDYLMIAGSSGAPGSSVQGIRAYQVTGNSGTVLGLTRANYPGRLSTPNINLGGNALNVNVPYRAEILIERGLGPDSEEAKSLIWYGGPDQNLAINNLYQNVLIANAQEVKGDKSLDMVKEFMPSTFGGREFVKSYNALPGRLDGLCLSSWGVIELVEPSLYDFGNGVTTMPVVDINTGGYLTSSIFYYNAAINYFNSNMKAGVYVSNAAQPVI